MPQFRVLRHLNRRDHCLSDLAERQHVSLATMSKMVSGLVDRGYVERTVERADRRYVKLRLTTAGRRFYDRTHSYTRRKIAERIEPLSAADRRLVESGLQVLANAFAEPDLAEHGAVARRAKRKTL